MGRVSRGALNSACVTTHVLSLYVAPVPAGKRASSRLTTSSRNPTPSDVPEDETSPEQSSSSSEDDDAEDPDVQMDEAAAASEAASDNESSEDSGEEGSGGLSHRGRHPPGCVLLLMVQVHERGLRWA